MKTLYFDIDGTILVNDREAVKRQLGDGQLEKAIRRAGFSRLVCVGTFAAIAHAAKEIDFAYDWTDILFRLCRGAFQDEVWLSSRTVLVPDPTDRATHIDLSCDWWYVDDLAEHYMRTAARLDVYRTQIGKRICEPEPGGDGRDVLSWLSATAP